MSADASYDSQTVSDACEPREVSAMRVFSASSGSLGDTPGASPSVEDVLQEGLRSAGASPVHLAIRGTAAASSARCEWRGIARTLEQRNDSVRFWLGLGADEAVPETACVETLFTATFDVIGSRYAETAQSNFLAIARGGLCEWHDLLPRVV